MPDYALHSDLVLIMYANLAVLISSSGAGECRVLRNRCQDLICRHCMRLLQDPAQNPLYIILI